MRKLLKYDLRSTFTIWWIASLAMLGIAALGGVSLRLLVSLDYYAEDPLTVIRGFSGMMGVMAAYIGLIAYSLVMTFFLLKRFYCHFFTDEGYLTFTLPVSRHKLLASKVLMVLAYDALMWLVIIASVAVFITTGLVGMDFFSLAEMMEGLREGIGFLSRACGGFLPVYGLELALAMVAQSAFSALFAYLCITIGAIVAKKQKILAAVGVYYGGTTVLSFVLQIAYSLLFTFNVPFIEYFTGSTQDLTILALLGLGYLLVVAGAAALLFWLVLRLLRKRLNLA